MHVKTCVDVRSAVSQLAGMPTHPCNLQQMWMCCNGLSGSWIKKGANY